MTDSRSKSIARWLPSLTDVVFLMPAVFLFAKMDGTRSLLGDGDTGWHVRIGDWMRANGRVPETDFFSFTMPGAPFYAWEWLWDLGASWLHAHGGMGLVVLANLALISFTFALLFRLVLRKCENRLIAAAVTLLAMAASSLHWLARPHLVTLLFVVIFLGVLDRVREDASARRLLWWLPALMVVWTNLHGGFFVGLMLLAIYAIGETLEALVRGAKIPASARWFAWTGLASFGATFLNPYTYRLHVHIAEYLAEPYHREVISEFQSINFHFGQAFFFEAMMVLAIAAAMWNLMRMRLTAVLLLVAWMHLALIAGRNIAIFVIIAAPLVSEAIGRFVGALIARQDAAGALRRGMAGFSAYASELGELDRLPRAHAVSIAIFALIAAMIYAPQPGPRFRSDYDPKKYPAAAIEQLRGSDFSKSIFTHDEWGDYLIYRMYPETKVFVDGRSDFYGAKFGRKYIDVMKVNWTWEPTLLGYGVDTILLPPDEPLTGALKESSRWCLVYDDSVALIFRHHADQQTSCSATFGGGNDVVARSQKSGIDDPTKKGVRP